MNKKITTKSATAKNMKITGRSVSPLFDALYVELEVLINPGFRRHCHELFCVRPLCELIWRADYRVRYWLTVACPTDISSRNPKSSLFVEAGEGNDEAAFIE